MSMDSNNVPVEARVDARLREVAKRIAGLAPASACD